MDQQLEQKCRYLLNRGRVSRQECADILSILDERITEATYWKAVAEKALNENGELKAEVARLSQIARY
jgi:hypothetical protein